MNTHKTIAQLVDENFVHASVLYHFGIPFFDLPHLTLAEACEKHNLPMHKVKRALEQGVNSRRDLRTPRMVSVPVDLIVAYLRHAHQIFVKERLPYIGQLIGHLHPRFGISEQLVEDLQFVFPLFAEDFIHHVYEEEDTLFTYIATLQGYLHNSGNATAMYYQMEHHSIRNFAVEHLVEDDEMQGIRRITHDYAVLPEHPALLRVVYRELQAFEEELVIHARVENEILFPKALMLERKVREQWSKTITQN